MKNYTKACLGLLLLVCFATSCQQEESETYISQDVLDASSPLTNMLKRVAQAHAVDDNVMDSATCYKLKLPVQLRVNGQPLSIQSEINYQQIADVLNTSNSDQDHIDFVYPLTAIYSDGTETIVENRDQLRQMQNICAVAQGEAPIGCIDVAFPFAISLYNQESQIPQIVAINNSYDLLAFIANLGSSQYYQINYPLTVSVNDVSQAVRSNADFVAYIGAAVEVCSCENSQVITDNLLVYMPLAGDLTDLTGFAVPTPVGFFSYVTDRSGNTNGAISLDANDENTRIEIPQNQNNTISAGESFTLSLWFRRQDANPLNTFEQLIYSPQLSVFLGNNTQPTQRGPVVMYDGVPLLYDFSWANASLGADIGNWHHVAITYSTPTGALILYRDGNLVAQAVIDGVSISDMNLGGFFKGSLDDLRIYKRNLAAAEIATLYNLEGDINPCLN